ncbi:hypothetical protein ACTFIU_004431 [Dictyostelium citrinum]
MTNSSSNSNKCENKNYYEILKVSIDADIEEIKKSYRKLALLYHPDKLNKENSIEENIDSPSSCLENNNNNNNNNSNNNNSNNNNNTKDFNDIQIAWETLKDDLLRKQYDSLLLEKKRQKYSVSDEIDLDDMEYIEENSEYIYPCRCGDHYIITEDQLSEGSDVVCCSGCSLSIKVIYQME